MSVYPERRKGSKDFTGYWLAEVVSNGQKTRQRFRTHAEALAAEAAMKGTGPGTAPPEVITMGKLMQMAEGKLYRGAKDELRSGRRLAKAVSLLGRELPVDQVRLPQLEALVDKLRAQGMDPKTINRYLASISKLLRWAHKSDLIAGMPHVPRQKEAAGRKVYLPEHLDGPFLEHIEAHAGEAYAFAAEVLLLTGMRIGELFSLSMTDVDEGMILLSDTKAGTPRAIPVPEGYDERLREWIEAGGVSYRRLLDAIGEASQEVCGRRLTCHSLRHTTATRLTSRGIPTLTVAEIMGHRNLSTTRIYTHHSAEGLRSAMATLTRGRTGADTRRATRNPLKRLGDRLPSDICSPLRSHSATRPSPSSNPGADNHLPESD